MDSFRNLRSLLFVPGSRPEFVSKAERTGTDAIILDLEDSVPLQAKEHARIVTADALRARTDCLTLVRVNRPELGMIKQDLSVLAGHPLQVVLLPKVNSVEDVGIFDRQLTEIEQAHGLSTHAISLMVGIESAAGLRILYDALTSTPRARGAVLATAEEGDLMVDIGGSWTPDGEALAYSRGKFICDARAAGATWLMDGAFMNLENADALEREAKLARVYGFNGKVAVHPRQVATINMAFSPTVEQVGRARRLIRAFRAAEAEGRGAVKFEGMMVDYANFRQAKRILELAQW